MPNIPLSPPDHVWPMNYLRNLKIGKRLALGLDVLFIFSMFIAALGVVKLIEIASTSQEMMEVPVTMARLINDWSCGPGGRGGSRVGVHA
jgi:hypothetical protein